MLDTLRKIQSAVAHPNRVALVIGDEINEAEAVPEGYTMLTIIVDGAFLSWLIEDAEWDNPSLADELLADMPAPPRVEEE